MCNQNLEEVVLIAGGSTDAGISVTNIYFNGPSGGGDFNNAEETISWIAGGESGGGFEDQDEEDQIITDDMVDDYPCQSEIIQGAFIESAPLSKLILDIFELNDNGYNLVFWEDPNIGSGDAGGTYPISVDSGWELGKLDIQIGLSNALLNNGTDLAIVATAIHESIHAILIYGMETGKLTVENTNGDADFNFLVRSYLQMKIEIEHFGGEEMNAGDTDFWMHQYMTDLVGDIATSISEYGKSNGYNISYSYYEKLAWLGLKDSLEFILANDSDGYTEEDEETVESINKVIIDEFQNKNDAKGKKCNNN
ncbi:hypothetical protein EGM88_15085 [Aureibaculum marinum]|uniref:Uncharacterized protein n=1 Tax=Aureibaculum marinum TaxID=2487930 RepID=A0A3N4N747_9FLAO